MSNKEVLEKAIQRAIDGGWQPLQTIKGTKVQIDQWHDDHMVTVGFYSDTYEHNPLTWVRELEGIIFNHDFAKALWGDDQTYRADCIESPVDGDAGFQEDYTTCEYHLREMVISQEPIKYLGEHL